MKKAIIFDLDGTLSDSLGAISSCANECLVEQGLMPQPKEDYKMFVGDGQFELIKRALRAANDTNLVHYETTMARYIELFKDRCHKDCPPYEGAVETLKALKDKGIKLCVLSNKAHVNSVKVVETIFGKDTFDIVQGQVEGVPKKPSPEGVFNIIKELSLTADEVIYTGDTSVDMKTGKAAGVFTIGVTWGFRTREELEENKADAIIDKPSQWLDYVD